MEKKIYLEKNENTCWHKQIVITDNKKLSSFSIHMGLIVENFTEDKDFIKHALKRYKKEGFKKVKSPTPFNKKYLIKQ